MGIYRGFRWTIEINELACLKEFNLFFITRIAKWSRTFQKIHRSERCWFLATSPPHFLSWLVASVNRTFIILQSWPLILQKIPFSFSPPPFIPHSYHDHHPKIMPGEFSRTVVKLASSSQRRAAAEQVRPPRHFLQVVFLLELLIDNRIRVVY